MDNKKICYLFLFLTLFIEVPTAVAAPRPLPVIKKEIAALKVEKCPEGEDPETHNIIKRVNLGLLKREKAEAIRIAEEAAKCEKISFLDRIGYAFALKTLGDTVCDVSKWVYRNWYGVEDRLNQSLLKIITLKHTERALIEEVHRTQGEERAQVVKMIKDARAAARKTAELIEEQMTEFYKYAPNAKRQQELQQSARRTLHPVLSSQVDRVQVRLNVSVRNLSTTATELALNLPEKMPNRALVRQFLDESVGLLNNITKERVVSSLGKAGRAGKTTVALLGIWSAFETITDFPHLSRIRDQVKRYKEELVQEVERLPPEELEFYTLSGEMIRSMKHDSRHDPRAIGPDTRLHRGVITGADDAIALATDSNPFQAAAQSAKDITIALRTKKFAKAFQTLVGVTHDSLDALNKASGIVSTAKSISDETGLEQLLPKNSIDPRAPDHVMSHAGSMTNLIQPIGTPPTLSELLPKAPVDPRKPDQVIAGAGSLTNLSAPESIPPQEVLELFQGFSKLYAQVSKVFGSESASRDDPSSGVASWYEAPDSPVSKWSAADCEHYFETHMEGGSY